MRLYVGWAEISVGSELTFRTRREERQRLIVEKLLSWIHPLGRVSLN
jgi:hypothetical protein